MNRRSFMVGILAAGAAPAIVRVESLMKIWTPSSEMIVADGLTLEVIKQAKAFIAKRKVFDHFEEISDIQRRAWARSIHMEIARSSYLSPDFTQFGIIALRTRGEE